LLKGLGFTHGGRPSPRKRTAAVQQCSVCFSSFCTLHQLEPGSPGPAQTPAAGKPSGKASRRKEQTGWAENIRIWFAKVGQTLAVEKALEP
jgi:hypothetical protein